MLGSGLSRCHGRSGHRIQGGSPESTGWSVILSYPPTQATCYSSSSRSQSIALHHHSKKGSDLSSSYRRLYQVRTYTAQIIRTTKPQDTHPRRRDVESLVEQVCRILVLPPADIRPPRRAVPAAAGANRGSDGAKQGHQSGPPRSCKRPAGSLPPGPGS